MENEPEIPLVAIECMNCGENVNVNDDTSELWLFTDEKHINYSFVNVTCDKEECGYVQSLFVDQESVELLSFLTKINVKSKVPKEFREKVATAYDNVFGAKEKKWGKKMLQFLTDYQPEAYEFEKYRW